MKKWMLLLLAGLGVALAGFYFAGGLCVGLLGSGVAGVDLTVGLETAAGPESSCGGRF